VETRYYSVLVTIDLTISKDRDTVECGASDIVEHSMNERMNE